MAGWRDTNPQRAITGVCIIAVLSLIMTAMSVTRSNASFSAPSAIATAPHTVPTTTSVPPTTTTMPPPPTTTTTVAPPPPPPPPPPTTTTTAPPPVPAVQTASLLPPRGAATVWGCTAAMTYMRAYADPTFQLVCPGDAQGHQAVTCFGEYPCAAGQRMIAIADPCPAAYMNEAHNSWVLDNEATGAAIPDGSTAIDPYGYCH